MATFRQEQIDDILNYDRAMNRIVLDNEIGQATRFNDERNPPTNRDIKFEALIGTLVDDLKAKIAEALTSIASKQFPKTDATKVTTLLGLPTGERGANFKNMNYAAVKRAQDQQSDADYAAAKVREAEIKNSVLPEFQDEDDEERDVDAPILDTDTTFVPRNILRADAPEFIPKNSLRADADVFVPSYELEPESSAYFRNLGLGKPSKKRRFILRGGDEGTADGLAKEKSHALAANATENILYDIVNKYNGIVDKLLQATQPDGRFASKRTVSASSVGYLADVLKGLNEPLRHLVFELSQVHNPNLASVMNMMTSMVDIIDTSPPFQKVNVIAYKSGMPDFQGLNSNVQLLDVNGYIADLKSYREKLAQIHNRLLQQSASMMFNIADPKLKQSLQTTIENKIKQYRKVIDDISDEVKNVRARSKITNEFEANGELIKAAQGVYEDMEEIIENGEPERQEVIKKDLNMSSKLIRLPDEAYAAFLVRLEEAKKDGLEALKYLTQWKIEHNLQDGDDEEIDDAINRYHRTVGEIDDDIKSYKSAIKFNRNPRTKLFELHSPPETGRVKGKRETSKRIKFQEGIRTRTRVIQNIRAQEALERQEEIKNNARETKATLLARRGMEQEEGPSTEMSREANNLQSGNEIIQRLENYDDHAHLRKMVRRFAPSVIMLRKKDTKILEEAINSVKQQYGLNGSGMGSGGSGGLADLLSTEKKTQYRNHREITDDDKAYRELTKSNENWQATSNPPHTTPVGSLYPFYKKEKASLYSFPLKLKHDLAKIRPDDTQKDARGADISLLQGPIGETNREEKMPPKRKPTITHRTQAQATENIIKGRGKMIERNAIREEKPVERAVGMGKKNPRALHKILFDDESNEMFGEGEACGDGGMIPEEPEEEDEDRFRNKKLGPKKKKSVKK
jgi:hypothetical protein